MLTNRIGRPPLSLLVALLLKIVNQGHYAIAVFIVLSGYVLMLPVARSADGMLRGGIAGFIKRRSIRILPTYYAALFIFSGLIYYTQVKQINTEFATQMNSKDFILHLFLLHNLSPSSVTTIDGPMWSLATEWQIYFVFAIVLLPIYRRMGIYTSMLAAFILSLVPHFILPTPTNFDWACPWYLALFSCGMFAACVGFGTLRHGDALRSRVPWGIIAFGALCTVLFFAYAPLPTNLAFLREQWVLDTTCGFSATAFLLYCTGHLQTLSLADRSNAVLRFLQSRPVVGLGIFSYTLYLFNGPFIDFAVRMIRHFHLTIALQWLLGFSTLPFVVALCYLCYLFCERPFTNYSSGKAKSRP